MKNFTLKLILVVVAAGLVAWGAYFTITTIRKDKAQTQSSMMDHMSMGHGSTPSADTKGYQLKFQPHTEQLDAGKPTRIVFDVTDASGKVLKDLAVAHEKLMHFIIVRKDLQEFLHLHPEFDSKTGRFSIDVTYPSDGPYRLFADFTPNPNNPNKETVTLHQDVTVGDQSKFSAARLSPDRDILKTVNGYNVNYNFPETIKAGTPIEYTLIVEKSGETVELEPYLGAMGHSVVLKEDSLDYIHAHPMEMDMSMGMMDHEMGGGVVTFDTSFSSPGLYKIFTQFQVKGQVMTSEYTIKVQ